MREHASAAVNRKLQARPLSVAPAQGIRRLPLYEQVKHDISELILSGAWARGTQIPGELELAGQYRVSVGTVRRALGTLVAEGLLARRRRHGTVVTDRSPHHSMRFLYHYYRLHRDSGELVRSEAKVLSVATRKASDDERRQLELVHPDRRIIEVRRVRAVDGRPAMHETVLLPSHRFPDFPGADDLPALMYVFYLERYGIHLVMARESLRADAASKLDSRHLGVPSGHPILEIEQTSYDSAHSVVEWRLCRTVTDRFRYVNEVR